MLGQTLISLACSIRMKTQRLEIRPVVEPDRTRYVDLFMDPAFMVHSAIGPLTKAEADARFDHMLAFSDVISFCKQAVVERATESLVGYVGADEFEFRGKTHLEFGYRLIPSARGQGYATEAGQAILEAASEVWHGELLAFIDPANAASRGVLTKLRFELLERTVIKGGAADLYRRSI